MNNKKIKSLAFSDQSTIDLNKLNFSKDVYDEFKRLHPNDCAAGTPFKLKMAIENYRQNQAGDGFALSYLFSLDFKNSALQSSVKAPISFTITKKPEDKHIKIGETQIHRV